MPDAQTNSAPDTNLTERSETTLKVYPLSELLASVQRFFKHTYNGQYWITAEVLELNIQRSGHYYFELGELENDKLIAKVSAHMWAGVAANVVPRFEKKTGGKINKGMKLMLQVRVEFTPMYGLALNILNINPEFTLGHLERLKRETIERLTKEGIIDLNKAQYLPLLALRFAVISSDTAAGWGDFKHQVALSPIGSLFTIDLYPALMQGERTTKTVIEALDKIVMKRHCYDAVIVIRGGGGKIDLSYFDEYHLCSALAQFPLPVLTGIGHERDESVADMVAFQRLKTPTAVAEFIVQRAAEAILRLLEAEERLDKLLTSTIDDKKRAINDLVNMLKQSLFDMRLMEERRTNAYSERISRPLIGLKQHSINRILAQSSELQTVVKGIVNKQELICERWVQRATAVLKNMVPNALQNINFMEQIVKNNSPESIMKKGFMPIMLNGKQLFRAEELRGGEKIDILFVDGEASATITEISKREQSDELESSELE